MYIFITNSPEKAYSIVEDIADIPQEYILAKKKLRKKKNLYSHEDLMKIREELLNENN
jgi:hypothetical protein